MKEKHQNSPPFYIIVLLVLTILPNAPADIHVWQMQEFTLKAQKNYENCYTEVTCWVDLKGPNFSKRIYGFWDGGNDFVVRMVATEPGKWQWQSGSNQPDDSGLNGRTGEFLAVAWTQEEKLKNPNRRGFVRPSANGHALQYADGTPFFMVGDTWRVWIPRL